MKGDKRGNYKFRICNAKLYRELVGKSIQISPPKTTGPSNTYIKVFIEAYKPDYNHRTNMKNITLFDTFEDDLFHTTNEELDYYFSAFSEIKKKNEMTSFNEILN